MPTKASLVNPATGVHGVNTVDLNAAAVRQQAAVDLIGQQVDAPMGAAGASASKASLVNPATGVHGVNTVDLNAAAVRQQAAVDLIGQQVEPGGSASPPRAAAVQRQAMPPSPSIHDTPLAAPEELPEEELPEEELRVIRAVRMALGAESEATKRKKEERRRKKKQTEEEAKRKQAEEEEAKRRPDPTNTFKYGEIYFEETGTSAPYLIVPEDHKPEDLVRNMAMFMAPPSEDPDATENDRICKPSILFEVRAKGLSYMDEAKDVIENDFLHKQWFGQDSEPPNDDADIKDQHVRKFCDRNLDVFKDVVKGVVNAQGWFLNSAGRGAAQQMIGDCIDTFDALEGTTWVNFASLNNEHLFAAPQDAGQQIQGRGVLGGKDLHKHLVSELREHSVFIPKRPEEGQKTIVLPELKQRVTYYKPRTPFPKLADLQGSDPRGQPALEGDSSNEWVVSWLKERFDTLFSRDENGKCFKEEHLHPRATHFIFFEEKGAARDGGQMLPWNKVDELRDQLTDKQGAAEGLLLMNGNHTDFSRAAAFIAKSNPVIAFKTVGGASEQLSRMIDLRVQREQEKAKKREQANENDIQRDKKKSTRLCVGHRADDPTSTMRDGGKGHTTIDFPAGHPHPEEVLNKGEFANGKVYFDGAIERALIDELIVIDMHPQNKNAGVTCQKQMAQMLTMIGGDEERQIGFRAAERQSMAKAWDHTIRFDRNARSERLQADILNYAMLVIGLLLVFTVVMKQSAFPPKPKVDACGHVVAAAAHVQHKISEAWLPILRNLLLVMPIVNGLVLTINTKFNPYKKFVIYKWASEQCVSETYKYRARATPYNEAPLNLEWVFEDGEGDQKKKLPLARRYTDGMKAILDTVMADSTVSESSMRFETDEELKANLRRERLGQLKTNKHVQKHTETPEAYDKLTEIPPEERFTDDGYSSLTVHEYIACRTIPQHRLIQETLPALNSRKSFLQILMYVMSAVSVMLATLNMDLYIAISTAGISLLSGIMEYQKLETRVASLNRAFKELTQILHDWDSYGFVERRKLYIKNEMVRRTEAAVMLEVEMFYDMTTGGGRDDGKEGGSAEAKEPEKKG